MTAILYNAIFFRSLRTFYFLSALIILLTVATHAHAEISVGQAFGAWKDYIDAIVSAAIMLLVGLVLAMVYKFTGIKIEDSRRDALQTALTNAAGKVVASVGTKLDTVVLTTGHPAIDDAINMVLKSAPDAVAKFGLTPDMIREKIIAKIPQITSAAIIPVPTR